MTKKLYIYTFLITIILMWFANDVLSQQQRFPKPEFYTGYEIPETATPEPRAPYMQYVDLFLLLAVMSVTTWLVLKKRSRKWIMWMSVFTLAYFGFYRNGCICSVGAIQNISLSLFDVAYVISLTALAFFVLPLIFALFFGRVFCASVCPLGVIQDLVIVKPIKISPWLQKALGLFPFVYLALAVLYSATATSFIICKYDPFVGFFRMGAEFSLIVLGILFLAIGMFIARPFCRFICPYGALLKIFSINSKHHLSITPKDCINCNLCKDSCPFGAIDLPTTENDIKPEKNDLKKFIIYAALIPLLIFVGGWTFSASYKLLSKVHPDVHLVSEIISQPDIINNANNIEVQTFLASGKTFDELFNNALLIQQKFKTGGWFAGGFIGLIIGLSLLNQVIFRRRNSYEANKGNCYSCGRCMDYCPVGKPEHQYFKDNPEMLDNLVAKNTNNNLIN